MTLHQNDCVYRNSSSYELFDAFEPQKCSGEKIEWTNDMAGGPTRTLPQAVSGDRPGMA